MGDELVQEASAVVVLFSEDPVLWADWATAHFGDTQERICPARNPVILPISLYRAFCICKCINAIGLLWDLLVVAAKKNYPCKWEMLILLNYSKPLLVFFKWDTSFMLCSLFWEKELKRAGEDMRHRTVKQLGYRKIKISDFTGFNLTLDPNQERETDTDAGICSRGCSDHSGKI